jgi:hypothetical protein
MSVVRATSWDAVLDDLLAAVPEPPPGDPVERLSALMLASYDVLVRPSGLVPLYLARQGVRGEQGERLGAVMDALLAGAGVEPVARARSVLIVQCMGSAAFARSTEVEGASISAREARDLYGQGLAWVLSGIVGRPVG